MEVMGWNMCKISFIVGFEGFWGADFGKYSWVMRLLGLVTGVNMGKMRGRA